MVQFAPFAAWRYDLSQVGELSAVTAPAPELIDEVTRERLYERHPCNAVRLVLNRAEPGDQSAQDRHARADDLLRLWRCEGVLIRDHDEAIYLCQQTFLHDGATRTSLSLIGRLRLNSGEHGLPPVTGEAFQERLDLIRATHCQLFPVLAVLTGGAVPEADRDPVVAILRQVGSVTPLEVTDDSGTLHRVWPIRNRGLIQQIQTDLRSMQAVITGGADQFAAVVRYRNDRRDSGRLQGENDPANFVLACLMSELDEGLLTLPGDTGRSRLAPLSGLVFCDMDP